MDSCPDQWWVNPKPNPPPFPEKLLKHVVKVELPKDLKISSIPEKCPKPPPKVKEPKVKKFKPPKVKL